MSEWWTYSLSDFLLFSPATYFRLFELQNEALWPWQVAAVIGGLGLLAGRRLAFLIAGAAWLSVAWLWQLERYATINWSAEWLAYGFALQAFLLWLAAWRSAGLHPTGGLRHALGFMLTVCALLLQPLLPWMLGRPWMQGEVFALTPGPTVIATLGLLLMRHTPWWLLVLPLAWCVIDAATLWTMKESAFWLLPAAGLLTVMLRVLPTRQPG